MTIEVQSRVQEAEMGFSDKISCRDVVTICDKVRSCEIRKVSSHLLSVESPFGI